MIGNLKFSKVSVIALCSIYILQLSGFALGEKGENDGKVY
jgi:hypothetical protein